jgi:hypothetical protein
MQMHRSARFLSAIAALSLMGASAHALQPTIEFIDGPVASLPITTGSISFGGVTGTGAPLIGGGDQSKLELDGTVDLAGPFNPQTITLTEFNLPDGKGAINFVTSISGTLPPLGSVTWSAYYDAANTPFGEGQLLATVESPIQPRSFRSGS